MSAFLSGFVDELVKVGREQTPRQKKEWDVIQRMDDEEKGFAASLSPEDRAARARHGKSLGRGMGAGALIGAGGGAVLGGPRVGGRLRGGAIGALLGFMPGLIAGGVIGDRRTRREHPDFARRLDEHYSRLAGMEDEL